MAQTKNLIERLREIGINRHNNDTVIYKYMPAATAKLILENATLLFQVPANFNDPFEVHMGLLDFTFEKGKAADIYIKYINQGKPITEASREAITKLGDDFIANSVDDIFRKYRNDIGITCFTKTPINTLMWSHYADSHRGVCMGFKIEGWNRVRDAFEVNYVPSIKPIKFFDDTEKDLVFWYWMYTKSHVWKYEEEIRVVNMFSNGIQELDDIIVKEIYYGAGMKDEDIEAIENLSQRYYGIEKRAKMKIDMKTFDLVETQM